MSASLSATGLTRRFGGLLAVSEVSLTLATGTLHAVIGPNGAGKSTLINLLAGELPPSDGRILLGETDVTAWPEWRRARAGIGRTFQRTNVMGSMTVLENVRLAAQVHATRLFRSAARDTGVMPTGRDNDPPAGAPSSWRPQGRHPRLRWLQPGKVVDAGLLRHDEGAPAGGSLLRPVGLIETAQAALRRVGLDDAETEIAATLSHGRLRLLEIAIALAGRPKVLLLDEPLAGMGAEESAPLAALLRTLARDHAVLLVEHDMDVVFAVADVMTVMVDGRVLENGTPAEIRASAAVRDAYLGHSVSP